MQTNQTLADSIFKATNRRNAQIAKEAKRQRKLLLARMPNDSFTFAEIFAVAGVTKGCLGNKLDKMVQHKELVLIKDKRPWIYVKVAGAFDSISTSTKAKEKQNA